MPTDGSASLDSTREFNMSLTESQAREITLVRVLETHDNGELWTADDAREATRVAKAGEKATFDQFIARRAKRSLSEIRKLSAYPITSLKLPRWPTYVGGLLVVIAMLIGFVTDHLVSDHRVNIVELPLVGLILWNLIIFIGIFLRWIAALAFSKPYRGGLLTELLGKWHLWEGMTVSKDTHSVTTRQWLDQFRTDWISLSARLNQVRLEMIMHMAAMSFTLGTLASLYFRGFFKEYRAGWESTFFSADSIHGIASLVLMPGAFMLNMQIPDIEHIANLRFPESSGEIARDWIHLYAASILAWVLIPRALLVISNGFSRWRLQRYFPLPLSSIYFKVLSALYREGKAKALVIPFRYDMTPQIKSNLSNLLGRVHGLTVDISIQSPVLMGEDTSDWKVALGDEKHFVVFVVFNLTATAESDTHGNLMDRVRKDVSGRTTIIPIVDISSYAESDKARHRQRQEQWRSVLDKAGFKPLFLDISRPDDEEVFNELKKGLNDHE